MYNAKSIAHCEKHLDKLEIICYVLHNCSEKDRQRIEAHLSECSQCLSEVVYLTKNKDAMRDDENWNELPDFISNKGINIIK